MKKFVCSIFVGLFFVVALTAGSLDKARKSSVMVIAEGGSGSGVAYKNSEHSFVWTDAHVVSGCKTMEYVFSPKSGSKVLRFHFSDVSVKQEIVEDGRKVGEHIYLAKIIRYSEKHDLALLKVYKKNWPEESVEFETGLCPVGAKVWHVGSMLGWYGPDSVSHGVLSAQGRLRRNFEREEKRDPVIYDQIALVAMPGSSGGGVFAAKGGKCVGIVTEYLGITRGTVSFGALLMTPSRRVVDFAKEYECEWAVNRTVAVPSIDNHPVLCDEIPIPPGYDGPTTPSKIIPSPPPRFFGFWPFSFLFE